MSLELSFRNGSGRFVSHRMVIHALAVRVLGAVAMAAVAKGAEILVEKAAERVKARATAPEGETPKAA